MFRTIEDVQTFSKGQFEAATQSATALSNGLQQIVTEAADFSRKSLETSSDAVQQLLGSKTADKAFQVQFDYAKRSYDIMVAETTKLSGLLSTTAQEAYKPFESAYARVQAAARSAVATA